MVCSLCNQEKVLIKKSHIIPDFMYKGMFDDNHFIYSTNLTNLDKYKKLPNGIYEKNILCAYCDNVILGKLESYASNVLYGGKGLNSSEIPKFQNAYSNDGIRSVFISNIDYNKFKLFLLSILWRAHLSNHSFFSGIKLGTTAETLRKMIYENDGGNEDTFETCLVFLKTNNYLVKSISVPRFIIYNEHMFYVFLINKVMYFFNVSSYSNEIIKKGRISTENKIEIAILENEIADNFFESYFGKTISIKDKNYI